MIVASFRCPDCGTQVTVEKATQDGYVCAKCQFTKWRNWPEPAKPYRLSENDRIMLRVNRIVPDA